jgi:hypothetical protein
MQHDEKLNRRGWLRSLGLTAGAAGAFSLPSVAALAGESTGLATPGVFKVTDYGARGDGRADDSDPIQRAINAAQEFRNGGIVFLPTGSYIVSKTLLITGRVKIAGQGQATIDGATHIVPTSLDFDVIKAVGVNYGVVLEGFTIRTYSDKGSGGHFLRFEACQHVRVNGVSLSNFWNGALVDSSGDVVFYDMSLGPGDVPGAGRFGIKCTAASKGNPNGTQAWNCSVGQWGKNLRTVDAFVLANGYNSFSTINCGAMNCNRAFRATRDGGSAPNFFVVLLGTSDHCNTAVQLDAGSFSQFSEMLVTSSYINNINVDAETEGSVAFSNCVIAASGTPPHGTGYRISSTRSPNVSITGGIVEKVGGNAIDLSGNAKAIITGIGIASIEGGKGDYGADGVRLSGESHLTLSGVSFSQIRNAAIRIADSFNGTLNFSGITQQNARHGLYDEGSSGLIAGNGTFHSNSVVDVDISKNRNSRSCIQTSGCVPWPTDPTPAVPGSGVGVRNTTGTNCMVYILGGKVQQVTLDGVSVGVQTSIYLPVDRQIAVRYSGDLTWTWQRAT